jgi:hypothetical protein
MWTYFAQAARFLAQEDALPCIPEDLAVPGVGKGNFLEVCGIGVAGVILGAGDEMTIGADVRLDEGRPAMAGAHVFVAFRFGNMPVRLQAFLAGELEESPTEVENAFVVDLDH